MDLTREHLLEQIHANIATIATAHDVKPREVFALLRRLLGRSTIGQWRNELRCAAEDLEWWQTLPIRAEAAERERDDCRVRALLPSCELAHIGATKLSTLVPAAWTKLAIQWQPADGGIFVVGPTGAGKSALAAFIARRLVLAPVTDAATQWLDDHEQQGRVTWTTARAIGRARRAHPLGQGDPPEVRAASDADVTVIDDLGWEGDPSDVLGVIADRYDTGRPSIVTSGLTEDALRDRYGAAVIRRVLEAGGREGTLVDLFAKPGAS